MREILKPFIPWVGGKTALRPILYQLFPSSFHRLVEVFGGGAAVLFGREPGRCVEVYNDRNSDLVNLFLCVKRRPLALMRELGFFPLNSREEFYAMLKFLRQEEFTDEYLKEELEICERYFTPPESRELKKLLLERAELGDVHRAAAFYKIIRYSYAGGGNSYGGQPQDIRRSLPHLWACSRRLADVVIENQGYETIIPKYDAPGTLLYLDPPYYQAECYEVAFSEADHYRLRECIGKCQDSFVVLSYNDCPFIRKLYEGYWIFSAVRPNSMANRYRGGSEYAELIILNYDPNVQRREKQMTLFEEQEDQGYEYTLVSEGRREAG